ncbi:hypothetical protein E4K10_04180 [Streptomyces sp. T1317-0309]|nr:hypothetical protein E4K10_04180 [Streptomyces sp. T1317-0309]
METTFFAYGAVALDGVDFLTDTGHEAVMGQVAALGVQTTSATDVGLRVYATLAQVQARVEEIQQLRAELPFAIDGVVIKPTTTPSSGRPVSRTRHRTGPSPTSCRPWRRRPSSSRSSGTSAAPVT